MDSEKEEKKPTIPLTTVTNIVSSVIDDSVKVSKSFYKLVRLLGRSFISVDARVRKCIHRSARSAAGNSS